MPSKRQSEFNKLKKKVNRMDRTTETKHVDIISNRVECNSDVNKVHACFLPAQGDAHNERVGDKAAPYRLTAKIMFRNTDSAASAPINVRVTVLQSKQRYTPSTITTSGVTQLYQIADDEKVCQSHLVHDNRTHFVLLFDKSYVLSPAGNSRGLIVNINKKISRMVEFEPGSTVTESGQIWICLTSDIVAAATGPSVQFTSRVLYKDA